MTNALALILPQLRTKLTAATTFYVRTTGNDGNDGSSTALAFLTPQACVNYIYKNFDCNGQNVFVNLSGTFTSGISVSGPLPGGGLLVLGGTATISTTSANCITASYGAQVQIQYLTLQTTTSGACISSQFGATVTIGSNMIFGTCAASHLDAQTASCIVTAANYSITGGAVSHIHAHFGGSIALSGYTITLTGTPAFSAYFCGTGELGVVDALSTTFVGSATGPSLTVAHNSAVRTDTNNTSFFPGNSIGSVDQASIFDDYGKSPGRVLTISGILANTTVSIPAKYYIRDIIFQETAGNAVTGGIKVGTTSGGVDVVVAQTVGADAYTNVGSNLLKNIFSPSAATTLYVQAVSSWNSANVTMTIIASELITQMINF